MLCLDYMISILNNRWILGWVDKQGRVSIGKKAKEFLDLETGEFVYVRIEATGKLERNGLASSKEVEVEED